jgi:hypothetical protein
LALNLWRIGWHDLAGEPIPLLGHQQSSSWHAKLLPVALPSNSCRTRPKKFAVL